MPDRFDTLHLMALLAVAVGLIALVLMPRPEAGANRGGIDKAMERQLQAQARSEFLRQTYAPVEVRYRQGDYAGALLSLQELGRRYPGDPHGDILRGEILLAQQAWQPATTSFVRGVKGNGDYVDPQSPLSHQGSIRELVEQGLKEIGEQARRYPDNLSLQTTMRELYYLQSRLAGGCE